MSLFKNSSTRIIFCVFSGLLVAACFPGAHTEFLSVLLPIALIPIFFVIFSISNERKKITKSIFYLWLFGLSIQLPAFFWITQPILFFSTLANYIAYPLYVLICALTSLYFPILFSPIIWHIHRNKPISKISPLLFSFILTFFEISIPCFFNWTFGSLMYSQVYVSQLSSLFGFNTASVFIFFTSLSIAKSLFLFEKKYFLKVASLNVFIWISIISFGAYRIHSFDDILKNSKTTRIAFVQPNFTFNSIASLPLPSKDSQIQSLDRLLEMSSEAIDKSVLKDGKKPDLLVWPESGAPDIFLLSKEQIDKVTNFSKQTHVPVLVQALQWKLEDITQLGIYNSPLWSSSVIVNENGLQKDYFQKWVPMPFGEMFPMERTFPILGKWYRSIFSNPSKLEVGTSYQSLPYNKTDFVAPLICFDSIEQKLPYLQSKKGNASIFVNQANFVWMVDSNAGSEFSMLDRARSIENARSSIMVSNTGPTVAFDPLGRIILPPSAQLTQATGFIDLPIYTGKTLFSYVYYFPLLILGILAFGYYAALSFRERSTTVSTPFQE